MTTKKHNCPNRFQGDGARGGCFVEIEATEREGIANLQVGWSCVVVHRQDIPISWLSEIIAIATAHKGGVAGYLAEQRHGGDSYALQCDPVERVT